jgi:hypothetical protein
MLQFIIGTIASYCAAAVIFFKFYDICFKGVSIGIIIFWFFICFPPIFFLWSYVSYLIFKKTQKSKDKSTIDRDIKNLISQEQMILPVFGDIFVDNIGYEIENNKMTLQKDRGSVGFIKFVGGEIFKIDHDNDPNSDMVKAFRKIQKTRNEGFQLRKGMVNFLNAYLQAFLDGNYRDLAKELLNTKPRQPTL